MCKNSSYSLHILMMMRMIIKTLINNASLICRESHFTIAETFKNAACDARWQICILSLGAKKTPKQASQSRQIVNRACQSTGVNTDEEQLMESWPHFHTA